MSNLLYDLLPGIYRELDESGSMALRALLQVIEDQRLALEQDTADLYDDWFIETCDKAAIPGIADLLGLMSHGSGRAAVANAIACRRRKGTHSALETRVVDVSGWPALATFGLADLDLEMDQIVSASSMLTLDVWRQPVFPVERATPCRIGPRRYTFHPMGLDIPLFQPLITNYSMERPRTLGEMPVRILPGSAPGLQSAFSIVIGDLDKTPLPVVFGDLSLWDTEPSSFDPSSLDPSCNIAVVDPLCGRFLLPEDVALPPASSQIAVDYAYAFSADLGGGPYPRHLVAPDETEWIAFVHRRVTHDAAHDQFFSSLRDALRAFDQHPGSGTIRILDSSTYTLPEQVLETSPCVAPGSGRRTLTIEALSGEVPCLSGALRLSATGPGQNVILNGLWIDGPIELGGDLMLDLRHCTVRPIDDAGVAYGSDRFANLRGILAMPGDQSNLHLSLVSTISGPVQLPATSIGLTLEDSIVDSIAGPHVTLSGVLTPTGAPPTVLDRTTVLGSVLSVELCQTDSIIGSEYSVHDSIFLSRHYGDPDYARLSPDAPFDLLCGASNGSEKGAFNQVGQPHRLQQLEAAVAEFVPDGIATRIVFQS